MPLADFKILDANKKDEYIYTNGQHHISLTPVKIKTEEGIETHWNAKHLETKRDLGTGRSRGIAIGQAVETLEKPMEKSDKVSKQPKWSYKDGAGVPRQGILHSVIDRGGTDVTHVFQRDDGEHDLVSGSRLKEAKIMSNDESSKEEAVKKPKKELPSWAFSTMKSEIKSEHDTDIDEIIEKAQRSHDPLAAKIFDRTIAGKNIFTPHRIGVRFSPDGNHIAELTHGAGMGEGTLYGVTVLQAKEGADGKHQWVHNHDKSKSFNSREDAEAHINSLQGPAQGAEKSEKIDFKEMVKKAIIRKIQAYLRKATGQSNVVIDSGLDKEAADLNKAEKKEYISWETE